MRVLLAFAFLFGLTCSALAQSGQETITLLVSRKVSSDGGSSEKALLRELEKAGFSVKSTVTSASEIKSLLRSDSPEIGLMDFSEMSLNGSAAAGYFQLPGFFRDAQEVYRDMQGAIGDVARDQVSEDGLFTLRTWPMSANILATSADLKTIGDLKGSKIASANRSSDLFLQELGAAPVQMAESDIVPGLERGAADVAILPQSGLVQSTIKSVSNGTIISDFSYNLVD